ncbi:MAG: ATPase RavA [candidate division BRC1 bacterium ADurb.BinA364]|nr:MAG: ATPase RavA [candidate division BRC1 bacterium ADurb.BinA364]
MPEIHPDLKRLHANIASVIKGKDEAIQMAIVGMLARGHLLFEDVPGVGKTTLAQCLARSISCHFQRIQFTSDLLPSDIIGVTIFDPAKREFEFKPGPLFANLVLADEINRTTPKTQSSLLEAMNTAKVSVDKITHELPRPFIVIATQNPIEFHGTFPLPKSQMDRFMLRLSLGYPSRNDEMVILREQKTLNVGEALEPVLDAERFRAMQREVEEVAVEESILDYIVRIARATRESPRIELGVSIRGSLSLRRAAQALAYFEGRNFVVPDDVKRLAVPALAHRLQIASTFETAHLGEHEDEKILADLLAEIEVPI